MVRGQGADDDERIVEKERARRSNHLVLNCNEK